MSEKRKCQGCGSDVVFHGVWHVWVHAYNNRSWGHECPTGAVPVEEEGQ